MADSVEKICAGCGKPILVSDEVSVCACGAAYHKSCWMTLEHCKACNSVNPSYDPILAVYAANKQKSAETPVRTQAVNELLSEKSRLKILHGDGTGLFSDIAGKIQTLAVIIAVAGAILGLLTFILIAIIDEEMILPGLLIGVVIAVLSWAGTFTLYGFGTLIKSEQASAEYLYKIMNALEKDE